MDSRYLSRSSAWGMGMMGFGISMMALATLATDERFWTGITWSKI
jgi:hypothetical protein